MRDERIDRSSTYLSCRHIERGIVFWPGRVSACCGNPASGAMPTVTPFTGGELSPDVLLEGRARIIARHKARDIAPECLGCPRLTENEWSTRTLGEYLIDEVTIAHFSSCNIRCNYCYTVTNPELAAP